MHEHIGSFKQNPSQKFHKNFINFEKPQKKFQKLKTYVKMNEMHDKREKRDHTRGKKRGLGRNPSGEDEEFECEVLGREREAEEYQKMSISIG